MIKIIMAKVKTVIVKCSKCGVSLSIQVQTDDPSDFDKLGFECARCKYA